MLLLLMFCQASKFVSGSITGVPKDLVLPVFERAGRLHLALAGTYLYYVHLIQKRQTLQSSLNHTCFHCELKLNQGPNMLCSNIGDPYPL